MRRLSAAIVTGLLAGCGGDSGEPAGSDATSAAAEEAGKSGCELLTDPEVSKAIGASVASHEESGLSGCRWTAEGNAQLMLDVYSGSSMSASTCDRQRYLGTGRQEAVAGLGDSALWKTSGSLVVCSTRAVIRFNVDNTKQTVPQDKEGLVGLARLVIDRV